ncbi:MAG TPA: hypothetical protein VFC84_17595 [Desulfosporosinus sp.]|nr:hypothetical protein [Desulfosporosinus sp.]
MDSALILRVGHAAQARSIRSGVPAKFAILGSMAAVHVLCTAPYFGSVAFVEFAILLT